MSQWLNKLLDRVSEYLAPRKGLLPMLGLFLIGLDFVLQFILPIWLGELHILLYAGLFVAIVGLMVAQVL